MKHLFRAKESPVTLQLFPIYFYLFLFGTFYEFNPFGNLNLLEGYQNLPSFYLSLLRLFENYSWIVFLWKGSLLASTAGPIKVQARVAAFILTLFLLPVQNSFGVTVKSNLIIYPVLLAMCFLPRDPKNSETWVLEYCRRLFLFVFFAAGCTKALQSPIFWMQENFFREIVYSEWLLAGLSYRGTPWLAQFQWPDWTFHAAALVVLFFELFCLLGLLWRKLRPLLGSLSIVFFGIQYLLFGWFFVSHLLILPLLFAPNRRNFGPPYWERGSSKK